MTVQAIKIAIKKLPLSKRLEIVRWVTESAGDAWDRQIVRDADRGALDFLVREGKSAAKNGGLKPFPRT